MLSKEELEKKRLELLQNTRLYMIEMYESEEGSDITEEEMNSIEASTFDMTQGFDKAVEILWPEIERLRDENEKLQAKLYFLAGVLSTHDGFTNKTLDQIFEWADKEIEGEK